MSYRQLFVICEGDHDELFFETVCKPALKQRYQSVVFYQYAQKTPKDVRKLLRSLRQMNKGAGLNVDCLYIRDFDRGPSAASQFDRGPSIADRKDRIQELYNEIERERIVLVVQMIEGWYAAGVSGEGAEALGVKEMASTDSVIRSIFDAWMPDRFGESRIDFMRELLKYFDRKGARAKNRSFDYFCTTFLP